MISSAVRPLESHGSGVSSEMQVCPIQVWRDSLRIANKVPYHGWWQWPPSPWEFSGNHRKYPLRSQQCSCKPVPLETSLPRTQQKTCSLSETPGNALQIGRLQERLQGFQGKYDQEVVQTHTNTYKKHTKKHTNTYKKHTNTYKITLFDKPHIHSSNPCHSQMPKLGARIQPARIGARGSTQVCRSPACFWMSPGHQSPSRESRKKWFLIIWYFLKHGCYPTWRNWALSKKILLTYSPKFCSAITWVHLSIHVCPYVMISICVHAVHSIARQLGSRPVQSKHRSWSGGRHSQSLHTWLRPCSPSWKLEMETATKRMMNGCVETMVVTRYDCCGKAPIVFPFRWDQLTPRFQDHHAPLWWKTTWRGWGRGGKARPPSCTRAILWPALGPASTNFSFV